MDRAHLALAGLSVGDAFGECFFSPAQVIQLARGARTLPAAPLTGTGAGSMRKHTRTERRALPASLRRSSPS